MLRRRRPEPSEAGFSVIELVVVLAIMLIVLGVLGDVLLSLTRASNQGEALVANEQQVHLAVLQLGRDLRAANPLDALGSTSAYSSRVQMTLQLPNGARTVTDADTTAGSTTVTSASANFTASDVGDSVTGVPVLPGTTIASVTNASTAVLSEAVMQSATAVSLTFTPTSTVTWLYDSSGTTCGRANSICRQASTNGGATSTVSEVTNIGNGASQPVFTPLDRFGNPFASTVPPSTVALCATDIRVDVVGQPDPNPRPFEMAQDIQLRNQLANLQYAGNNPC